LDTQKNIRAFLAIEPPEEVLAAVVRLQEKLKREIGGKISWTRPQGNHLTLTFFGDISPNDVRSICLAVEKRAIAVSPLSLAVEALGVFPDARKPRVLWSGITKDLERLKALQSSLTADFEGLGFAKEDRPFRAHLTLARIRVPRAAGGIEAALNKHNGFSAGEFQCRELVLFQSTLAPQGAIHTRLKTFPLGA
jgi:RNA 2',3'-cyclic 3'-phosphodiesterase